MKILQMSRWFFPHVGGASVRVYQVAKNLTEMGHEVHLLTHNPQSIGQCNLDEEAPLYEEHPDGFKVYRLPYYNLGNSFNWAVSIPLMTMKAVEIIKKEEIDVILSHNPPYIVGVASLKASMLTGKPMVTLVHDIWGASHYSALEGAIGGLLEGICVKNSKKLIVPLGGLDDILMHKYGVPKERFVVAETGVDTEKFKPIKITKAEIMQVKKALESCVSGDAMKKLVDPSYKKVLFLGILAPWSGCEYLIEAAKRVNDETLFIIVGHGVQQKELVDRAAKLGVSDRVAFVGTLKPEVLPVLMNMADVCVSPFPKPDSVGRENAMPVRPISTLEFMSCGRPVVMSDIPGAGELIMDGKTGVLFKAEDPAALAEKIIYLLGNPRLRADLSKNAREFITSGGFEWKDSVRKVERALSEAVCDCEGHYRVAGDCQMWR